MKTEEVLTEEYRRNAALIRRQAHAEESEDVVIREFRAMGVDAAVIYVDGLAGEDRIQRFLMQPLLAAQPPQDDTPLDTYLAQRVLPLSALTPTVHLDTLLSRIFSGDAALIVEGMPGALVADVKCFAHRMPAEPVNESVVMGPHEGFNESLRDNVVMIRRLMRSPKLISEALTVGDQIPSRLCLMYLSGVARPDTVAELRRRVAGCRIDYVSSLGMLEQLIEDRPSSLLPQCIATERPDRAVSFLNEGQVLIVMENAPAVLALPATLLHLFHAPDDTAQRWPYGTFLRILRLFGLFIALILPGLFICLTVYHPEGMSLSLLTSVMESQERVPFSLFTSTLLMLLVFSLISEAGARVPGAMGSSISIVGGLILGQAAVQADLISPLVIIVVALSGLGSYAVPVYSLTLAVRMAQLFLVLLSGLAGMPGLMLGLFALMEHLCGLTSLNVPFFAPLSPRRVAGPDAVAKPPVWRQRLRGMLAAPGALRRTEGGPMRAWARGKEEKGGR
ncbi:MAG: spore germination protein [Clostridiales bacterium]|nr:spore germination protein [Clostridiales bacterium]